MNKQRAFTDIKTISDLKEELKKHPNYLQNSYLNPETLEAAIKGLEYLSENEAEAYLEFVHHVDKALSMGGTARGNRYHKLPTIMAGLIYYAYYPSTISELSLDEITILSKFSIINPLQFYENSVEYYGKDLLDEISKTTNDFMYRDGFMHLAETKLKSGIPNSQVVTHFANTPLELLKEELFTLEREEMKEVGKYL